MELLLSCFLLVAFQTARSKGTHYLTQAARHPTTDHRPQEMLSDSSKCQNAV